jgi:hypothetical protein
MFDEMTFRARTLVSRWREGLPSWANVPSRLISEKRSNLKFARQFSTFSKLHHAAGRSETVDWVDRYPCLGDATGATGFDRHYIYHPAWAARILSRTRPLEHTDISSTLTFSTLLSAFIPTRFFDYRPAPIVLDGLQAGSTDLVNLHFADESIDSLSCMHVMEHIGLGRYGDALDPMGDRKAAGELQRVLKRGGNLLVVVPVGRPRVQFNAHRIYDHRDFRNWFDELELAEFSLVPDGDAPDGLIVNPPPSLVDEQEYGCGCYWLRKP